MQNVKLKISDKQIQNPKFAIRNSKNAKNNQNLELQ